MAFAIVREKRPGNSPAHSAENQEHVVAQKVQVILVDDIDGGNATETVSFGLDGASYEIDLSAKNAAKLRDTFASYVGSARKVGSGGRRSSRRGGRRASAAGNRNAEIRAWAKSKNMKVSERGRLPADVIEKYDAAHS
jgi:nucleoid-associated protein Lsr2